jgi:CheY-like chemotaxis protein
MTLDHAASPAPCARKVLIVDDNRDSARMLGMLLQMSGHTTQEAFCGEAGLAQVQAFAPDVVLLDIGLPDISGLEVCRRVRALGGRQPYLIALTGWGTEEDIRSTEAAGFDRHLVKPVEHSDLLEILERLPQGQAAPLNEG